MKKPIGIYRKCDFVTMCGTCFAIVGIILAINKLSLYAIFCLIISAICDAFDGIVARKSKSLKEQIAYGVELDSLSDAISFGILPMVIVLSLIEANIFAYIISVFFCLAGVIRLAYFNMLAITNQSTGKEFIGLPITASAIILPISYFIINIFSINYINIIYPIVLLITGLLYISPFKLRKPTIKEKVFLSILGIITIVISILKICEVI